MAEYDPITIYDRPRLAAENIARGDVSGAGTALFSPESLSPYQRGWIESDDGGWKPKGNSFYSTLLRTITNPVVLVAAVLAWRWPMKSMAEVAGFVRKAGRESRMIPRFMLWIQDFGTMFRGTPVKPVMDDALHSIKEIRDMGAEGISKGITELEKRTGRQVTTRDEVLASISLDELDRTSRSIWRRAVETDNIGRSALYLHKHGDLATADPGAFQRLVKSRGDEEIEALISRISDDKSMKVLPGEMPDEMITAGRQVTEDMWGLMDKKIMQRMAERHGSQALRAFKEARITPPKWVNAALKLEGAELKKVKGYWPHVMLGDAESYQAYLNRVARQTQEEMTTEALRGVRRATKRAWARQGFMIPSVQDLKLVSDRLSPDVRRLVDAIDHANMKWSGTAMWVKPPEYSLRYAAGLESYVHSWSQAITFTGKDYGPRLQKLAEDLREVDPARYQYLKETFLPIAQNRLDPTEATYQLEWGHYKYAAHQFFQKESVRNVLGARTTDWFLRQMEKPGLQNLTYKKAGAKIAGYFYTSTLGGNLVSPALNIMQPSMGLVGVAPKYITKGGFSAAKMAAEFLETASRKGSIEEAWLLMTKKYPAFRAVHNSAESEVLETLRRVKTGGPAGESIRAKAQRVLMSLFSGSERWNKLWAFETGRIGALTEGMPAELAKRFASTDDYAYAVGEEIMRTTQFGGGPWGTPAALVKTWAPWRQFMQFPLRTLGLALSDPGVLGRMTLAGVGIYEAGRLGGLDLSRGTLFGALPVPYSEDNPFYPWPLVPPLAQIGGSVASDLFTGEFDKTRRSLPLLVPGGVGLSRASQALFPKVAKGLGRPYADYQNMRPDGTYPVYSGEGNLIGFKRPVDLYADAIGWTSLTGAPVQAMESYLVKNRDKIRDIRRQYVEAIAGNNMAKANSINEQYKKAFPGLGDIVIKQQDIQAVHLRHDVSRIERILQTMPKEMRSQYAAALGVGMTEAAEEFMGVDPGLLLGGSTVRQLDPRRLVPLGPRTRAVQQAKGGVPGLRAESILRPDQYGERPNEGPFGSFSGFEGY